MLIMMAMIQACSETILMFLDRLQIFFEQLYFILFKYTNLNEDVYHF